MAGLLLACGNSPPAAVPSLEPASTGGGATASPAATSSQVAAPEEDDRYVYFPLLLTIVPITPPASPHDDIPPLPAEHDQGLALFSRAVDAATEREAFVESGDLFRQAAERFATPKNSAYQEGLRAQTGTACHNAVLAYVRGKACDKARALLSESSGVSLACAEAAKEALSDEPEAELCPATG
jgi:hypothetical protein